MINVYTEMLFKYMFIFLQNIFKIYKIVKNILVEKIYVKYLQNVNLFTFWNKINVCTVGFLLDFDIAIQTGYFHPDNSNR